MRGLTRGLPRGFPRGLSIAALALLGLDLAGAQALDALGLVESLLSPSGARAQLVLPLALLFYGARLVLLFVVPGLLAGGVLCSLLCPHPAPDHESDASAADGAHREPDNMV